MIVEGLLVAARAEGSFDGPEIDIASAAQFAVGAYIGVEQLLAEARALADRIDDHLRLTLPCPRPALVPARPESDRPFFDHSQKTDRSVCVRTSRRVIS